MNDNVIYNRTRMGNDSLEGLKPGVAGISGDEKRVMMLIDGKASVGEITQKLPPSVRAHISEIVTRLSLSRFIAVSGDVAQVAPSRIARENVSSTLQSSQKLNKNMLLLAEIEIERRMELEQDLAECNAKLLTTQTRLDEVKSKLISSSARFQALRKQVLAYKQGMENKIIELRAHVEIITGDRQANRAQRAEIENDLKLMREEFESMQTAVEAKEAALDETLRSQILSAKRAEVEKRKQLKIQADEMVQTHPYYHLLHEMEFFKDFRNSDIAQFLIYSQWRDVKAGEFVVTEGDTEVMFYVTVTGNLAVVKGEKILHIIRDGEPFGEIACLDNDNPVRSASIVARTDCMLLAFNPTYLDEAEVIFRMRVAEAFMRIQAKRLRRAVEVVNNLLADDGGKYEQGS